MGYDVVIIGSGLGGLECGYMLSKEGYKVCILEKNRQFGGSLQIFSRDKQIFDTGIHYIGGLNEGQNLHTCFRYFGIMDQLQLKKLDEVGFDRISFDDDPTDYLHSQGYDQFIEQLHKQFPAERKALETYAAKIQEVCAAFPLYNLKIGENPVFNNQYLEINTRDYIASLTSNVKLQNVLAGSSPLYAGDGDKTPLYTHALVTNTYIESSYKCINGGSQIEKYLSRNIRSLGGEIRNYAEVTRIVEKNGQIDHIELADGEQIAGKAFISNIHPHRTLELLETNVFKKAFRQRILSLQNSVSTFMVDIALKPNQIPLANYNRYHFKRNDVWTSVHKKGNEWPDSYFVFFPQSTHSGKYADSCSIMTYMNYEEVEKWGNSFSTIPKFQNSRGNEYEEFKLERAERVIREANKRIPGLAAAVRSFSTSSPLTYRDYLGSTKGGLYGLEKDCNAPLKTMIAPKSKIPNLYFTGQNLNIHGVLGVTLNAIRTCGEFVGENYLIDKIRKI